MPTKMGYMKQNRRMNMKKNMGKGMSGGMQPMTNGTGANKSTTHKANYKIPRKKDM